MTPEGLLRRYYALRTDPDRRKLDTLIEEAAKALGASQNAQNALPHTQVAPAGPIAQKPVYAVRPACPPHLVPEGSTSCAFCSWKMGDQ